MCFQRLDSGSTIAQMDYFRDLYQRTSAKLFGVSLRILRDRAEAEEALQEVYVKIWQRADRYVQGGYEPEEAALKGTTEVASAITSSTLTTIAVFLPLALVGGIVSKFFVPLSLTVALALVRKFLDWDRALRRLDELNARVEDPKLWDNPKEAQNVMRERRRLEAAIGTVNQISQEMADAVEFVGMGGDLQGLGGEGSAPGQAQHSQ